MAAEGLSNVNLDNCGTQNYQEKYKVLKQKLKFIVYEHECLLEELQRSQRKLLPVVRDRSFLLDRLLQYEKFDVESSDTDATETGEHCKLGSVNNTKSSLNGAAKNKRKRMKLVPGSHPATESTLLKTEGALNDGKQKSRASKKSSLSKSSLKKRRSANAGDTNIDREELERHLEEKQNVRSQLLSLEMTPHDLPDNIFSNDNSNHSDGQSRDGDLVVDGP